jgi:hypothetical protein
MPRSKAERWFEVEKKHRATATDKRKELAKLALTINLESLPPQMQQLRRDIERQAELAEAAGELGRSAKARAETDRRKSRKAKRSWYDVYEEFHDDRTILKGRRQKPTSHLKHVLAKRSTKG